jgi:DNA (cytosine-5)-methyltransferase 1
MPRMLDLFCCQGGAAAGYHRAGFEVVGVDIAPQPRYPFEFHQGDALEFLATHGHEFDVIHASPPCDAWTKGAGQAGTRDNHPRLIAPVRELLVRLGVPYVIENVENARADLERPILLCGEMFGLGVFRHRLFESSMTLAAPEHRPHVGRIGDGYMVTMTGHTGGYATRDQRQHGRKVDWEAASGIDWMTVAGLRESIPPAYTEHLGSQLLVHLTSATAA